MRRQPVAVAPAARRDAGVRVAVVTAAGDLSAISWRACCVGRGSSFEPHAEERLGQLHSCRWSKTPKESGRNDRVNRHNPCGFITSFFLLSLLRPSSCETQSSFGRTLPLTRCFSAGRVESALEGAVVWRLALSDAAWTPIVFGYLAIAEPESVGQCVGREWGPDRLRVSDVQACD